MSKLLKALSDSAPKRSAADAQQMVQILNKKEVWTVDTLKQERELLAKHDTKTAIELSDKSVFPALASPPLCLIFAFCRVILAVAEGAGRRGVG